MPGNPNIILRSSTYQYGSTTGLPLTYTQLDGNFIYLDDAIRNVVPAYATTAGTATSATTATTATSASFASSASVAVNATNAANALTASYIGNTVGLLNQNVIVSGTLSVSPYPTNYLAGKVNISSFDYRYNAVSRVLTLSSIESSGGTPSTQLTFNQEGGSNGSNGWSIQSTNLFDNSAGTPLRLNQYGGNIIIGASTDAGARLYINSTNTDFTNSNGANSHILLNNGNGNAGQTNLSFTFQGGMRAKIRADFAGNLNYVAFGNGNSIYANHYFYVNGDSGVGSVAMNIMGGTGRVGINNASPAAYLDVAGGTILGSSTAQAHTISGNLTLNGNSSHTITGLSYFNSGIYTQNSTNTFALNNTDQGNSGGSGAHLILSNQSTTAQIVLAATTNAGLRGKWRVDYQGNSNHVAYTVTGSHNFWINGDSTDGGTAVMKITGSTVGIGTTTPNQNYALEVATISNFKSGLIITGSLTTSGSTFTQIGNTILSGSLLITGSTTQIGNTILSGSLLVTGSNILTGTTTIVGTNTITGSLIASGSSTIVGATTINGNTTITGSLNVTGSQTLIGNKTITGSVFITGSKTIIGTNTITGSLFATGSHILTGTVTIANILTLPTYSGVLPTGANAVTGSIAASGSGANCKLYFYNGTWNALF